MAEGDAGARSGIGKERCRSRSEIVPRGRQACFGCGEDVGRSQWRGSTPRGKSFASSAAVGGESVAGGVVVWRSSGERKELELVWRSRVTPRATT